MRPRFTPPDGHPPFVQLPVKMVTASDAATRLAVHISGRFDLDRLPVVCLAGYQRNMTDFIDFLALFHSVGARDWPVLLIDLAGRGRSDWHRRGEAYSSLRDAESVARVTRALGIDRAVFVGQGHGGQIVLALGSCAPGLVSSAVLIDAGPVADPRGLVRLRNNVRQMAGFGGHAEVSAALRRILATDYPGLSDKSLDRLAERLYYIDPRGRARALFDPALITQLGTIDSDDVLEPQWRLFDTLGNAPLMLMRTQLSDQLRRETFEEMARRRLDAVGLVIAGEGSPALLANVDEVGALADFVAHAQTIAARRWR